MRIRQEIILGMGGVNTLKKLGLTPTVYHMNEGHSAFLNLELIKNTIRDKQVSFDIARDIASSKTVFTTHTPVPAGNDIFPIELVEKYFKDFWPRLGLTREEFLKLGMKPCDNLEQGFNMGILALKIAGKKNGVSKLHGEVSRELFGDVWPNIAANESPITYVTNGIHTCTWVPQNLKELYNKYLTSPTTPYWQDKIYLDETWKRIKNIPDEELCKAHLDKKETWALADELGAFDIIRNETLIKASCKAIGAPNTMIFLDRFRFNRISFREKSKWNPCRYKNQSAIPKLTPCAVTVAIAAPVAPQWK